MPVEELPLHLEQLLHLFGIILGGSQRAPADVLHELQLERNVVLGFTTRVGTDDASRHVRLTHLFERILHEQAFLARVHRLIRVDGQAPGIEKQAGKVRGQLGNHLAQRQRACLLQVAVQQAVAFACRAGRRQEIHSHA